MSIQIPKAPRPTHPETKPGTVLEPIETAAQLRRFQGVVTTVYWHDPYYVRPLLAPERRFLDPRKNPFFGHAEARLFIAKHGNNKDVGRIALALDREARGPDGRPRGTFGFLEFLGDARLPEHMLRAGVAWLRERGAGEIVGPCSFTPHHPNLGLLVENFDDDPVFGTPYNPVNYPGFLARLPLEKWRDLHAFELDLSADPPDRLARAAVESRAREGLTVRPLDLSRFDEDVEAARAVYNTAGPAAGLGFGAVGAAEWRFLVRSVRHVIDPALFLLLFEGDRAVGFAWALPDWNRVLKHLNGRRFPFGWIKAALLRRSIDRARLLWLGVLDPAERRGRSAALIDAAWRALRARGYRRVEVSQVPEDAERAAALLERLGGRRTRTWRLYRLARDF